jgi:hypothetical protein
MGHQAKVPRGDRSHRGVGPDLPERVSGASAPRAGGCGGTPASLPFGASLPVDVPRGRRTTRSYTPAVGAFLAPLVSHAGIVLAGFGAVVLGGVLLVVYRIRRRWRALRARADVRAGLSWIGSWRATGPGGGPARWRYELWQGVADATRALLGAESAVGGPIGDLRSLNRRLRSTAEELDGLLGMASGMAVGTPEVAKLRHQVADALAASAAIRRAALASASSTSAARAGELALDAQREVESVSAGVERSRAALARE